MPSTLLKEQVSEYLIGLPEAPEGCFNHKSRASSNPCETKTVVK